MHPRCAIRNRAVTRVDRANFLTVALVVSTRPWLLRSSGEGFSPSAVVALRGPDPSLRGTDGCDSCARVSAMSPRSRRRNLKTRGRDLKPGALF
ncbi:unnamed protein product [Sphagnum jensenii]|uniref:Uncharacterized protein n=1 Tax=Sphagnum jensenii TaxID=128206 RepID=A0ABP1AKH3_9BRYO